MHTRTVALAAGVFMLAAVVYFTFRIGAPIVFGFEGSEPVPVISVLLTALLMLIGLIFGCLFRQVSGRREAVNLVHELATVVHSSSFLSALCVSPFVFMAVYAVVRDSPGDPASMLLAFQNGFFCESVFSKLFPAQTSKTE